MGEGVIGFTTSDCKSFTSKLIDRWQERETLYGNVAVPRRFNAPGR